ncbi:MAG: Rieske (2Fe-2S) protein, partial [Dehalococcoidia bacterium]
GSAAPPGPPPGPPIAATVTGRRRTPARISRRSVLRLGFWAGLGAAVAGTVGITVDLVYPRGVTGFGGEVVAGPVEDFPPGSKTQITVGRFWLVHLTERQGTPGLLALWWKCPHLGCTVPWLGGFVWPDPDTDADKMGWFRCPCHGSTFTDAGLLVYGPSPRAMDTMKVRIEDGTVIVDTGDITDGGLDNPSRAVPV